MRGYLDSHHILHNRQEWELRPDARRLRQMPTLVPVIDRDVHERLHANVPPVPLLGYYALQHTLGYFNEGRNTLQSMDNLLLSIDRANHHRRVHPIERGVGELAMEAIELQRAYLLTEQPIEMRIAA